MHVFEAFLKFLFGPKRMPTPEEWAEHNAKAAAPDEIIAAHLIRLIAKDFDEWKMEGAPCSPASSRHHRDPNTYAEALKFYEKAVEEWKAVIGSPYANYKLVHSKSQTAITYRMDHNNYSGDKTYSNFYVNLVPLANAHGTKVLQSYEMIKTRREQLAAAARKAEREMQESKQKWDLVEKLQGLTRNEHGALVPVQPVE